jgi:hypothetical protein
VFVSKNSIAMTFSLLLELPFLYNNYIANATNNAIPYSQGKDCRSHFLLHAWCSSGADKVSEHGNYGCNGHFQTNLKVIQGHLIVI